MAFPVTSDRMSVEAIVGKQFCPGLNETSCLPRFDLGDLALAMGLGGGGWSVKRTALVLLSKIPSVRERAPLRWSAVSAELIGKGGGSGERKQRFAQPEFTSAPRHRENQT